MAECTQTRLSFHPCRRRGVHADFSGSRISSDGGALLLREVDSRTGIIARAVDCFQDHRHASFIEHPLEVLVRQRVFGQCLGYEDLNDHDALQRDGLFALCAGQSDLYGAQRRRVADRGKAIGSSSTLNRLELALPEPGGDTPQIDRYHRITFNPESGENLFIDIFAASHRRAPKRIILDLDATDDQLHGDQEGRHFMGYYDHYCYLPLYIFSGDHLLWAQLRTADQPGHAGSLAAVERIITRLREQHGWWRTTFVIRGDSGFSTDGLMDWCERTTRVQYVLGLQKNSRLNARVADESKAVVSQVTETGEACQRYRDFEYRTLKTWSRSRRVVAKVEALPASDAHPAIKANPRYVVTSLPASRYSARAIYRRHYCPRGDMENRIKEQQLCLFADRTSTRRFWSNQIRLWWASVAYLLMSALRRLALARTSLARAACSTIRERLLKIGATVRATTRTIWIHLSGHHPAEPVFRQAAWALAPPG